MRREGRPAEGAGQREGVVHHDPRGGGQEKGFPANDAILRIQ